jgi:hypothetical protein
MTFKEKLKKAFLLEKAPTQQSIADVSLPKNWTR